MVAANDGFPYLFTAGCSDIISLAGLLTYPCLQRLPLFKEWLCAANPCAGLTAAGTVADSLLSCYSRPRHSLLILIRPWRI